ncbi:MAG: HAMP domain-containing histidine kinase [Gemmatimonadetes bacterium]|nr:HAMP domain-containing histidine kinase [Gemmatimonadota bacterium]
MRSLRALVSGIAHDFNNALTAILGHVTLAREGAPAEREEMLAQATQAALGARRLTTQLLAFARGGEPVRRSTDLGLLLGDALALAGVSSHMRVDLEVAPGLWHALVDGGQFRQVVSTLVLNAEQATGEGAAWWSGHQRERSAWSRAHRRGTIAGVQIEFADNGPGVPADIRGRVVDPYFSTRPGGTGLGLTSALTICQNHEGTLTLDSAPGAGATFRVYLLTTDRSSCGASAGAGARARWPWPYPGARRRARRASRAAADARALGL